MRASIQFCILIILSGATLVRAAETREDKIVIGLPAGDAAPSATPVEFTMASYNVQARPFFDKAEEKLPLISPLLNRYDIALIQECFVRHELLWAGNDFPNKVYFGRLVTPGKYAGSGLSILGRFPVAGAEMEHFRDVGEMQNRTASKGILMARFQIGGAPVDIYDTHMEAGFLPEAQAARMGQARQMIEFVTRHSPPEHAVILMGDFNMGPLRPGKAYRDYDPNHYSSEEDMKGRTAAFEVMRGGLALRDASDEVHGLKDDGIERLLFRDGTRCRIEALSCAFDNKNFLRADGTSLSDGSPLVVRLRVVPLKP